MMRPGEGRMEIGYVASDDVRTLINSMGRTEDVRFSPNNSRLAIAGFNANRIAVLGVRIEKIGGTPRVTLTGALEVVSPHLDYPHGLDFLDDETLAVGNRGGNVAIFRLPSPAARSCELFPVRLLSARHGSALSTPGSVCVVGRDRPVCEVLVCNNFAHEVTRYRIDRSNGCALVGSDTLLKRWLNVPDGVCVSGDQRWIAISNHNTHSVLLYRWSDLLGEYSKPDGVLRGAYFPHGLRFGSNDRYIFLADAGAPFVHIYESDRGDWRGARYPVASIRIMDEQLFLRGRQNPQEGGAKGIDLDTGMAVLVTTSEYQPLACFDATAMLASPRTVPEVLDVEYDHGILAHAAHLQADARVARAEARAAAAEANAALHEARAAKFKAKAARMKTKAAQAKAQVGFVTKGRPGRIATQLSRLYLALKR